MAIKICWEYGLPFVWERIAADLGSESTFSSVFFDRGILMVGDKAIITGDSTGVDRIDLDIPDQVFAFKNAGDGVKRIQGVRDYQRELVFWNFVEAPVTTVTPTDTIFPNRTLVYNYRNNTWAIFRDNITAFGTFQLSDNVTWDTSEYTWDSEDLTWDDVDSQNKFPSICSGNQQGYVHLYGYTTPDQASLSITGISTSSSIVSLTIPNHNLEQGDIIQLTGLQFIDNVTFLPVSTDLNDQIFSVFTVVNANTITITKWSSTLQQYFYDFTYTPDLSAATYIGGGEVHLFPKLNVKTKDFNIFQERGIQTKLSYIDFLMDAEPDSAMSVEIAINTSVAVKGNLLVGNKKVTTSLTEPFYTRASDIAWFRFYATCYGQYYAITMTYDDDLMNDITTHRSKWGLNGITAWVRPGGKMPF